MIDDLDGYIAFKEKAKYSYFTPCKIRFNKRLNLKEKIKKLIQKYF